MSVDKAYMESLRKSNESLMNHLGRVHSKLDELSRQHYPNITPGEYTGEFRLPINYSSWDIIRIINEIRRCLYEE